MEAGIRDSNKPVTEADEDALKWNTDCVYFLASPLTCKKGSECEYRHSEYARVNPRDCWFWLNGNCLNPKCSFRHPPLDGLVGTPVTTSEGSSLPVPPPQASQAPQAVALTQIPAANTLGKQAVPCIYFQKGLCLKGDRCTFMHGPQPISIPVQQTPAPKVATSVTQPQTLKKASWAIEKCSQQQKIPQVNTIKPVKVPPKPATQAETTLSRNGAIVKNALPPVMLNDELPRFKPTNIPPVTVGNSISTPHRSHQAQTVDDHSFQNGREAGEFLGESSPGFDVLVDDELRESDYYHNEDEFGRIVAGHEGRHHKDEFGRITGHEGRHLKSVNEFNYGRSADYGSLAKFDREPYNDAPGYNQYGRLQQRRASSERISERPSVPERRGFLRAESPDRFNESDLRHRLSKQRRVGSRSAISPDRSGDFYRRNDRDWHIEEQRHRGYSQRDSRHLPPHESSISNRLQGRITRPGRFSPENNHNGFRPEREIDRGRNLGRLSPGKPLMPLHQVRHPDRLKQRVQEDLAAEGTFIGRPIRRYEVDFNATDFAGPKSLSELKGGKVSESSDEQPMKGQQVFPSGEQKNSRVGKVVGHQESEGSLSFEGPKPLSMILKRKREVDTTASGNGTDSGDREESDQKESKRGSLRMEAATIAQAILPSVSEKEANPDSLDHITKPNAAPASTGRTVEEEKGRISTEGHEVPHEVQPSYTQKEGDIETEDGMMIDEEMEDQELETFDERDEDYDYEPVDGGDFKTEEDENADPDEEYLDDDEDDGDDFAKRIGVMFS